MAGIPAIGSLRERVTIQAEGAATPDGGGGYTQTWATHGTADLPALIEPASAREQVLGDKLTGVVSHAITIRYLAGVTAGMRVQFGSRYFNIRGVIDPDERRRFLMLACEEGVAL